MSKPSNPTKNNRNWIAVGVLALAFVIGVAFLVPLGTLAQAYRKVDNTFSISDPTGHAIAAELRLCGETQTLRRSYEGFRAKVPITCEGHGEVRLRFANGHQASCPVGYVTPGAEQHFNFVVSGDECR